MKNVAPYNRENTVIFIRMSFPNCVKLQEIPIEPSMKVCLNRNKVSQ